MFMDARAQRHLYFNALAISTALIAVSLLVLPFTHEVFHLIPAFMAAFVSATGILDFLTALLLFELYLIEGRNIFFGAGCAYLVDALLVWPYGLTFPGVVDAAQSFSNNQTAVWLWLAWHLTFPVMISIGAFGGGVEREERGRSTKLFVAIIAIVGAVVALTFIAVTQRDSLPAAVNQQSFTALYSCLTAGFAALNYLGVLVLLRFSSAPAHIRIWLSVAMLTCGLDLTLNSLSPQRFTLPWYTGKFEMLMTAGVLLVALMRMWGMLYHTSLSLTRNLRATLSDRSRLQKRFDREHNIAAELQQASLPRVLPVFDDTFLSAVYRPAVHDLEIGGDWYDAFVLEDSRLVLTIGDVTGKGLAASLVMGKVRQMLRIAALTNADPSEMLNITDRALRIEHGDTIVTAYVAILDRRNGLLSWASAGHPPAFVRDASGLITALESIALPLGLRENDPPSRQMTLEAGSMLVAYTDGLVEAEHDITEGCLRVSEALLDPKVYDAPYPAQLLHDRLIGQIARDDIAIVTLKYAPVHAKAARFSWIADSDNQQEVTKMRAAICELLREQQMLEERIFQIELAFGELVGNVTRYAPGPFESILGLDGSTATLTVIDHGAGFLYTPPACADPFAENGRGLFLVASLCTSLEIERVYPHGSIARAKFAIQ